MKRQLLSSLFLFTFFSFSFWGNSYCQNSLLIGHNNEIAFFLKEGVPFATVAVEPAGLIFNDILEYSLTVSDSFPPNWGLEYLGPDLTGGVEELSIDDISGIGYESPWPGDSYDLRQGSEVKKVAGMLGYGRYKITVSITPDNENYPISFYLNLIDGNWVTDSNPHFEDLNFEIWSNGLILYVGSQPEIGIEDDCEYNIWELFDYPRDREKVVWRHPVQYANTWYFHFNNNSIPASGTPSSVTNFLLDVHTQFFNNISVASGKTLQISVFQKPDASWEETILKFNDTKSLNIYGNLTSTGTSSAPVIFTRSGASGTWNGIKFYSGSSGTLSHATIEHATKGVYTHSGANNITVGASTIQNFTEQGIYIYQSSPTVQNCVINNNAGGSHGIFIRGESNNPNMLNNTISNGAIGIERTKFYYAPGAGAATISGNSISNCSDAGIRTYYTAPAIYNNTISSCYNGIKLTTASAPDIHDNAFLQNQYSVRLDQSQPSRLKWNNFGDQSTNISLLINYLASGNNFADYQANNFYQNYTADVINYTSTTLMARGNYWEAAAFVGPVNATAPLANPNPNAGPGGQMGKSVLSEPIADNTVNLPDQFSLTQNYPNPFNPTTTLSFAVAAVASVHLAIYDSEGKLTFVLIDNQNYQPGLYRVVWDGQNNLYRPAASGIYFCRMSCRTAENQPLFTTTRKLVLTR